jgi:tRNA G18 (ribose-2'-O)-methylase SpoU
MPGSSTPCDASSISSSVSQDGEKSIPRSSPLHLPLRTRSIGLWPPDWPDEPPVRLEPIEAFEDPRVGDYRAIKDATLRDERGLFVVESRLCVRRLHATPRFSIRSILVTNTALEGLRDVFAELSEETPVYVASQALLARVVGYNLHRGCIAVAERGVSTVLSEVLAAKPRLLVGLEGVANPENVGNVFRNAVAFGADAVLLSAGCADPLYRKAIRVSMGGTLRTPFAWLPAWPSAIAQLRAAGFATVALATNARAVSLNELGGSGEPIGRIALILGAEGEGLERATREAAEFVVRIPMSPAVDSLNVATASGIALHHFSSRLTP